MAEPNYYAVIPANVRYADCSPNAKLLYGEITALTNDKGYCWASNNYFSKLYGVKPRAISDWISQLENLGFIESKVDSTRGNQRRITIVKNHHTYSENSPHNNKSNIEAKASNTHFLVDLISRINPREKPTQVRQRLLNARLKEYSEEEITKAAIAFSKSDWHRDNGQMTIDNLLAPSKFGRWYTAGLNEKVVTVADEEAKKERRRLEDEEMQAFREDRLDEWREEHGVK